MNNESPSHVATAAASEAEQKIEIEDGLTLTVCGYGLTQEAADLHLRARLERLALELDDILTTTT